MNNYLNDKLQCGFNIWGGTNVSLKGSEFPEGKQQSHTELLTVVVVLSLIKLFLRSSELYILLKTKLLTRCLITVQIQRWCSMSVLSVTKQTWGLLLWIDMKRMQYYVLEEFQETNAGALLPWIIIVIPSESCFSGINTLLYGLMWLISGLLFTQVCVAWFTAEKLLWCHSAFYIPTSSVQSWRHALLCFLLLLTKETYYRKKKNIKPTHIYSMPTISLWVLGFVPLVPMLRMSNAVTVNSQD